MCPYFKYSYTILIDNRYLMITDHGTFDMTAQQVVVTLFLWLELLFPVAMVAGGQ